MKTFFQLLMAGVTGGAIALAGLNVFGSKQDVQSYISSASYLKYKQSPINRLPGDFVEKAKKSTGAACHIYAEKKEEQKIACPL